MTRASPARRERRRRREDGRPADDARNQLAVDAGAALYLIHEKLGSQEANDLALALLEATEVAASKQPRGRRPDDWFLTGFKLPVTFKGRVVSLLAMSPAFDTPSRLPEYAVSLAKKIRRDVARARADPTFAADLIGARKGGTA
jgi:hypothetical protein